MTQPTWQPEDGHLLQSLREKAGIDAFVFSQMNTLSKAQLWELENGPGKSFYNEQIKRSTGMKLLKKLGHTAPIPSPSNEETEARKLEVLQAQEVDTLDFPLAMRTPSAQQSSPRTQTRGFSLQSVIWALAAIVFASIVLTGRDWAQNSQVSAAAQTPATTARASEPGATSAAPSSQAQAEDSEAASSVVKVAQAPATVGNQAQAFVPDALAPISCAAQYSQGSLAFTPSAPIRPGDYIFFEALEKSQLCVLDAQNKLTRLQLNAGMKRRVNGEAPFLVHTSDWSHVKMFYQGRRVSTGETAQQHLTLNSQVFAP